MSDITSSTKKCNIEVDSEEEENDDVISDLDIVASDSDEN
jgi:hypothetical protein